MSIRTLVLLLAVSTPALAASPRELRLDPGPGWRVLGRASDGYYTISDVGGVPFIRARYVPPHRTAIYTYKLPRADHYRYLSWRWRVHRFPVGADDRVEGRMDDAAAVYLTFAGTFHKYVIKYVWSLAYPAGTNFRTGDSGVFQSMQLVVLEGGPPSTGVWRDERIDVKAEFHRYFGGDPDDDPPRVGGIGLLSDGDGTKSAVEADYADFKLFD